MAKPTTKKETKKDNGTLGGLLESPAGTTAAPVRMPWHESTETRELPVLLTESAVIERARRMIDERRECEALADAKKASADRYKILIEEKEAEITISEDIVKTGKERAMIACRWIFEANGVDEIGKANYHSDMKTLVREDTGEAVEVRPITNEDRQVSLPLEPGSLADNVKLEMLTAAGWTVQETPEGTTDHEAAFEASGEAGERHPLYCDSMAEAIENAAALLLSPDDDTAGPEA